MKVNDLLNYQNDAMNILRQSFDKDKLFHAYIFSGEASSGMVDAAIYMAKLLLCKKDDAPCMSCLDCKRVDSQSHLNFIHVKPINDIIRKEQIEHVIKEFSMTSLEVGPQMYIIEDADKMNTSAVNALLKFLEEPNPNHYAFLTTTLRSSHLCNFNASRQFAFNLFNCRQLRFKIIRNETFKHIIRNANWKC